MTLTSAIDDDGVGARPGLTRRHWLAAALATLAGCGGVDSGGTGTGSSPTLAVGTVSGFGSIIVNGIRFDETSAEVDDDDGRPRLRDELKLGMRATVLASALTEQAGVRSAVAASVHIRSELGGPIEAIDAVAGRLVVLGQVVAFGPSTVIDGGIGALQPGLVAWVYGTTDLASGALVATRIERRDGAGFYKIRGTITAFDAGAARLAIGTLLVSFAGLEAAGLGTGRRVYLRLATTPVAGVWTALAVAPDVRQLGDRDDVELEGRITALSSPQAFEIDGVPVDAAGASFPDGTAGLVVGQRVEAEGRMSGGVLLARTVKVEEHEDGGESIELHGSISFVDAAARRFVVRGVNVHWDDTTRFDSSTAADIAVGREVEVKGRPSADGAGVDASLVHVER